MITRNIGILAHVDAGKTSLTEQLLYISGVVRMAGSVDDGTAQTDSLSVERKRGISVRTSTASVEWQETKINLIDTPGHVDFAGEVERSLCALDFAVVVVSAVEGVRAHTENIIRALDEYKMPRMVFVNKIDRAGADAKRVIGELTRLPAKAKHRVYMPFSVISDCGEQNSTVRPLNENELCRSATEALCDIYEEAEEAFLSDEVLPTNRADAMLKEAIASCELTPVLAGSAKFGVGIRELADFMTAYMPDSTLRRTDETCGVIFKIEHDKMMGKVAHVRLFGGQIKNRDAVPILSTSDQAKDNPNGDENDAVAAESEKKPDIEKVSQIRKFTGGKYSDAGEVTAGDIAALCGLSSAKTGRFVGSVAELGSYRLTHPFLRVMVTPKSGGPETIPKLAAALAELSDEEPYLDSKWENGQKEITINLTGGVQLEILDALLKERYNLEADFSPPSVIYKETPTRAGDAYADYTMPKPCWAVVHFKFEPMPRGYGVSYHGKLPNNQCFYKYQSHIRKSFNSCLEQGLHGWEVTDFKCTLVGGEHHTLHTHPLDFFVCTPMAFMNGLANCGSTLLEPLLLLRINCPSEIVGKVITEIVRMDGEYEPPLTFGDSSVLEAIVPVAKSMDFPAKLASMSGGKAVSTPTFHGYRECRPGEGADSPRRGVNPLDRSKWILWARGAYTLSME